MVYQPAVNEDVCVADFIVKHDHLSKIAARQRRLHRLKTRSDLHLKIFFFQSGDMYEASEKLSQEKHTHKHQ